MRIGFVYDAVYPWEKGGAQKRVWEIARRLADEHDVHLYGMHYWDGPAVMERNGITYHGVCEPVDLYVEGRRSIYQALYFSTKVIRPLLTKKFDVIDCQAWPLFPLFATKASELLRGTAFCATWFEIWDDYWYEYLGRKGVFGKLMERTTVRLPAQIITLSDFLKSNLELIGRTSNVSVVHNGVDYYGLRDTSPADEDWNVIYVGSLLKHKNVDVLLEAVSVANRQTEEEITCGIIGDGPEREALAQKAEQQEITDKVTFLGYVEKDAEVIANLKSADVFVLPSTREGFPNTIVEAGACGTPSIVVDHPDNGGKAVVKHDETGYITSLSATEMGGKIVDVCTNESIKRRLSDSARQFGKEHDWSIIVDEIEQVYSSMHQTDK